VKFKWYYIAIPAGLILAYLLLSPKSTLLKGGAKSSGSGLAADLSAGGSLATGLGNLWKSIRGGSSSDESSSEV
jgi:hypothetical protein